MSDEPQGDWTGSIVALIGALCGCVIGLLVGLPVGLLALSAMGLDEGTGMEGLAFLFVPLIPLVALGALGGPVGAYVALRARKIAFAAPTAIGTAALGAIWVLLATAVSSWLLLFPMAISLLAAASHRAIVTWARRMAFVERAIPAAVACVILTAPLIGAFSESQGRLRVPEGVAQPGYLPAGYRLIDVSPDHGSGSTLHYRATRPDGSEANFTVAQSKVPSGYDLGAASSACSADGDRYDGRYRVSCAPSFHRGDGVPVYTAKPNGRDATFQLGHLVFTVSGLRDGDAQRRVVDSISSPKG